MGIDASKNQFSRKFKIVLEINQTMKTKHLLTSVKVSLINGLKNHSKEYLVTDRASPKFFNNDLLRHYHCFNRCAFAIRKAIRTIFKSNLVFENIDGESWEQSFSEIDVRKIKRGVEYD